MSKIKKITIATLTILMIAIPLFAARGRGGRSGGGGRGFSGGRGGMGRGVSMGRGRGGMGRGVGFAARGRGGRGFVAARGGRGGAFAYRGGRGRYGYGRWGRGRYGYGRWGRGWRWGGSWYGIPWWRRWSYRPYWWVGAWPPVYVDTITLEDRAIDDRGYRYWEVYNSTDVPLTFYADDGSTSTLAPGDRTQIYRGRSTGFAIVSSDGSLLHEGSTSNHFIILFQRGNAADYTNLESKWLNWQ